MVVASEMSIIVVPEKMVALITDRATTVTGKILEGRKRWRERGRENVRGGGEKFEEEEEVLVYQDIPPAIHEMAAILQF